MKVAIIGSGNVASHLAICLHAIPNISVVQIISRQSENARRLGQPLHIPSSSNWRDLDREADLVIIAIKDEFIEEVAQKLFLRSNQMIIHTAGSVPASILSNVSDNWGVLYPLQTFSLGKHINWQQIPLLITAASDEVARSIFRMASEMSQKVLMVDDAQRFSIHLAAVFSCNFSNAMWSIAASICRESKIDFDLLQPLIHETVEKLAIMTPDQAQTGPAIRNDLGIMKKHLLALKDDPSQQKIYHLISGYIRDHHLRMSDQSKQNKKGDSISTDP